jgi:hypothetical protein
MPTNHLYARHTLYQLRNPQAASTTGDADTRTLMPIKETR